MRRQLFLWTIFIALTIWFTSCNGQVQKDLPKESVSESEIIPVGLPKIVSTQAFKDAGNVHCSLQDKAGNLWFGTTSKGLYKYDGKLFRQFTTADGLHCDNIWSIFEDKDGKIWIGTNTGLNCYDGKTFSKIGFNTSNETILDPTNSQNNTPSNNHFLVFSIMQDSNGKLWFATIKGVYTFDGKTFSSFVVNEGGKGFMSQENNVEYILEDNAGNIWFGGRVNEGVFRYDGKSIVNFKLKELKGHDWAWPALLDKNGDIWFSNWGGTYRYDGKTFTSFTTADGLCSGAITRIVEDKKGSLWFGSESAGVCHYDGESFTHFTTREGLVNNSIWTILEDRIGNIWIGTRDTGLSRYDGETFTSFSEKKAVFSIEK